MQARLIVSLRLFCPSLCIVSKPNAQQSPMVWTPFGLRAPVRERKSHMCRHTAQAKAQVCIPPTRGSPAPRRSLAELLPALGHTTRCSSYRRCKHCRALHADEGRARAAQRRTDALAAANGHEPSKMVESQPLVLLYHHVWFRCATSGAGS